VIWKFYSISEIKKTSIIWGFCIFNEKVISIPFVILGIFVLLLGVIGLVYSSPRKTEDLEINDNHQQQMKEPSKENDNYQQQLLEPLIEPSLLDGTDFTQSINSFSDELIESKSIHSENQQVNDNIILSTTTLPKNENIILDNNYIITFYMFEISERNFGIICAVINGVLAGSIFVPMEFSDLEGLEYAVSYASGQLFTLSLSWFVRYLYNVYILDGSFSKGLQELQNIDFIGTLIPGLLSAIIWEGSHISKIMTVAYVGLGVGLTMIQAAIVISGLWGIVYFKEMNSLFKSFVWFTSAVLIMIEASILGFEHDDDDD